jgi:magnesium chelatase family protein
VPAVPYDDLKQTRGDIDSATMRARIVTAREVQAARYASEPVSLNSELTGSALEDWCRLGETEHAFLKRAVETLGLSARAYVRILRIARTIADLDAADWIGPAHLAEAINYRSMDRQG